MKSIREKIVTQCLELVALVVLSTAFFPEVSVGGACCAGGSAGPTLITTDLKAFVRGSYSYRNVVGDAGSTPPYVFRSEDDHESSKRFVLESAYLVSDAVQVGASIPLVSQTRKISDNSVDATRLGDVAVTLGYEFLPLKTYSLWKPQGLLFLQHSFPIGESTYTSQKKYQVDAVGKGYHFTTVGMSLLKGLPSFDVNLTTEVHKGYSRNVSNGVERIRLNPPWGGTTSVGLGFLIKRWETYLSLTNSFFYEEGMTVKTPEKIRSQSKKNWNTQLMISRPFFQDYVVSAVYFDQTLLGPARNVVLGRGFLVQLQKNWPL